MRTDPSRDKSFSQDDRWGDEERDMVLFEVNKDDKDGPTFRSTAFSGGERNRLFMRHGGNYEDVTLVSGIDFREDGRGFVIFDFDGDGFVDMGITSPNYPRFRIVRNQIADRFKTKNGFVEIELVGGQTTAAASTEWSSRDPFGATVMVTIGDQKRMFQLSAGEGLASQNPKRIHVGMGESKQIDRVEVNWPSGKKTVKENVAAGGRLTIFENEKK
ncbi:MAG: ASPIC/UnbV domain-containing protein [Mariniblastus sp.]